MSASDLVLEMKGITKFFPPDIMANDHIDFSLRKGELHALLGENGAGKSTLVKILYGECKPDEGEILIEGRKVKIKSPKDALKLGIGMVHQHFRLVETLTIAENIALSFARSQLFPSREVRGRLLELSNRYGLEIDPDAYVWQLSTGEKQRVEILKVLYAGAKILVLDEPTSVLSPIEREKLFEVIDRMRHDGCSIVFITHRLDEAMRSDRITVLRKGRVVATVTPSEVTKEELAKMMVGRAVALNQYFKHDRKPGDPVLKVEDLWVMGDRGVYAVRGVSLEVRRGEVLGIAGVAGNGQKELVEAITGLRRVEKGRIIIAGREVTNMSARQIAELGVAHIPEDRIRLGLAPYLSLVDNYLLRKYYKKEYRRGPFIDYGKAEEELNEAVERYGLVAPSLKVPAILLSGGNMQKLILARELSEEHCLIVASHPTYGLDVATTEFVRRVLLEERDKGAGVLLVSEDLEEILALSDRVAVIHRGRIVGVFDSNKVSMEEIGLLMAGEEVKAAA